MVYLGDFDLDATLFFSFTTRRFTTGVPFALDSGAISVYKDADDTQTTTGVTLAASDDGITGWNRVTIDTSDAFYTTATDFQVVITTGTVDGVSVVGQVVAHFSIENRSALRPSVAGAVTVVQTGDSFARIGANGASLTALATQASVNTIDDFLDTEIAAILAAVDTEVAAIKAKTDSLTFTVATMVDCNVQAINDTTVVGDGGATPWGS